MSKRPLPKKTVSFNDVKSSPTTDDPTYQLQFSPKLVPIHLIYIFYSIFKGDLSPRNVIPLLNFHLVLLLSSQLLYVVVFNSSIYETRKSKQRQLSFSIAKEYSAMFIGLLASVMLTVPLYVALVLFGAPFTTYTWETLYLASHMALLSFPIVVATLRIGRQPLLYKYFASIAIGAWLGAIAIPLDWDRPWQNWPLPIVGGAYGGAIVGYTLSGFV